MTKAKIYNIPSSYLKYTYINTERYQELYQRSINDSENFWAEQAKEFITWSSPWKQVQSGDFAKLDMRWFVDGKLNACYNCVDRHLANRKNQIAIIWQGDDPNDIQQITYAELHEKICQFANVLKKYDIKK